MMNDNKSKVYSVEIDKCNELLPIDTIVNVGVVGQSVMIYGRMQRQADQEGVWDYFAFPYPQGYLSDEMNIFFNNGNITYVIFKGFESEGEVCLRENMLNKNGESKK